MSYVLTIREDAIADIERAAGWYEKQEPGLGLDFARVVFRAIDQMAENPLFLSDS